MIKDKNPLSENKSYDRRKSIRISLPSDEMSAEATWFSKKIQKNKSCSSIVLDMSCDSISLKFTATVDIESFCQIAVRTPAGSAFLEVALAHSRDENGILILGFSIRRFTNEPSERLYQQFYNSAKYNFPSVDRRNKSLVKKRVEERRLTKPVFTKCVRDNWNRQMLSQGVYYRQISHYDKSRIKIEGKDLISFTDCSYLGLNENEEIKEAMIKAVEKYGTNYSSSRILGGNHELHQILEEKIAQFLKVSAARVYILGYMANTGGISHLAGPGDTVIFDEGSHASIIDGCRLSGAKIVPFRHGDMDSLENRLKRFGPRTLVITDGVFSMEGDLAPLDRIHELTEHYQAGLYVDDAHGLGIIGPSGRGTAEHFNLAGKIDATMGTLSKTVPVIGGFIAGKRKIIDYLISSRSFLFTVSLPLPMAAAAIKSFELLEKDPSLRTGLFKKINFFKDKLEYLGLCTGNSSSPIVPVILGDEDLTFKVSRNLQTKGIFVDASAFPAVKKNKALLRFIINSKHTEEDLLYTLDNLVTELKKEGVLPG